MNNVALEPATGVKGQNGKGHGAGSNTARWVYSA
jgi:hypothetical protein